MSRVESAFERSLFVPRVAVRPVAPVPRPRLSPRPSPFGVDRFEPGGPRAAVRARLSTPQPPAGWFDQGASNACGTTALSYALWRLGLGYRPHAEIDQAIRNRGTFSDPNGLLDYARGQDCQAALYNHGSFEALKSQLALGRQALVLVDPDGPDNLNAHWLAVTAVGSGPDGRRWVEVLDPATGGVSRRDWAAFDRKWRDLALDGASTGYDRAFLLVDRAERAPLPPSNAGGVEAVSDVAGSFNDLLNGAAYLERGRLFRGLGRMLAFAGSLPFTLPGAVLDRVGGWLQGGGDALFETAGALWRKGGAVGKLAAPFLAVGAGALEVGGWLLGAAGNTLGFVGRGVATVARGVGDALAAVGDFFSSLF